MSWSKKTSEENLQVILRKHFGNYFLEDYGHINVSEVNAMNNLVILNKEINALGHDASNIMVQSMGKIFFGFCCTNFG